MKLFRVICLGLGLAAGAASGAGAVTIDGILDPGEWDAYYLGRSSTAWEGGMEVDVYAYIESGYDLMAAYKVDIPNSPGFATAEALSVGANFYYKTPQSGSWPDPGYTCLEMDPGHVLQTDGSDWVEVQTDLAGIEVGYDFAPPDDGMAEFRIPLSLLTYAGNDGQVRLSGQYWQYDSATPFYITTAVPEPATMTLLALGLGMAALVRRRLAK